MQEGDRVLERWQLVARVGTRDGVERWRAVATDTGEPGEVLVGPRSDARARAEFVDLHGALSRVRDPALAHTLLVRQADRPLAVRVPLETEGLASVVGPLDTATVAWIGARLVPAVLAAGPTTRGALRASDIGLDAHGHPVLAPIVEPMTRVALGSTRSVAPESFDGRPPDGAAGLYGLGVVLYQLATGREPPTVGTRASRPPPPPPSALRHGIPEALDRAILRLLSNDPGQRPGALPLLSDLAGAPVDLRTLARSVSPAAIPIATTRAAPAASGPATSEAPGGDASGIVLVEPRALGALDPAGRSHAAGVAGVPVAYVEGLVAQGLPLVLATTPGRSSARDRAGALARTTGLPVTTAVPPRFPAWFVGATGTAAGLVPAVLALVMLLVGWVPGAIGFALVTAATLASALLAAARQAAAGQLHAAGRTALTQARDAAAARAAGGRLEAAWRRMAEARLELARVDLPAAPASDLRGALKDLESRLEALAHLSETADRTLRQVDVSALRTRLGALAPHLADPAKRAERDRLARTVADLEAVEESRAAIAPAAERIVDALSEISAVLAQFAADEDAALASIDRVARRARSAAIDAGPVDVEPVDVEPVDAATTDADADAGRAAQQRAARAGEAGTQ